MLRGYLKIAGVILLIGVVTGVVFMIFVDAYAAAGIFGATIVAFGVIGLLGWWVDRKRGQPDY